ncbi:unnamed protein product, partial [Rotaria magnacalcarata]
MNQQYPPRQNGFSARQKYNKNNEGNSQQRNHYQQQQTSVP